MVEHSSIALARFLCTNHKLAIECGRALRYIRSLSLCKYCENRVSRFVEKKSIKLLICPLYNDIRYEYIVTQFRRFMPSHVVLIQIMSIKTHSFIKALAVFIKQSIKFISELYTR
jgi:hypothetical protein